jgi:hypothetical protein
MSVSITLVQKNTTQNDPAGQPQYVSANEVPATIGIPLQLFVFNTTDASFSHVAAVNDIESYPVGQAAGNTMNKPFYREAKVTRIFGDIVTAISFASHVKSRLTFLTNEYPSAQDKFLGETTTTFVTSP